MRRSEPWTPNILPLREPNRAAILKQKFQDSLALPFEQALPEALIQKVLREHSLQLPPNAIHTDCGGVGVDVTGTRFGQKFKQCREPSHCLVSRSRTCHSLSRYGSLQQSSQTLTPGSAQTPVNANRSNATS